MVDKKNLRGGAEKMREVAQLLCLWADDLETAAEKKGRKKAADAAAAEPASVEPAADAVPAAEAAAPAAEEAAAPDEIRYEDLRGLLAEKSAAGYRTQVIALINSFGAEKLSGVDPAHYGELWDAAGGLGVGGDADAG